MNQRTAAALTLMLLAAAAAGAEGLRHPDEVHLADVTQLTFGGENAEAYWSPEGDELIFQSTRPPYACDQIFRMRVGEPAAPHQPELVSTGSGRTTCAYFTYPAGERVLYSSTHLAGEPCPPVPDFSRGYVWPIYPSYEIFSARPDGTDQVQITDNTSYDAEATVCPLDGTIVFTSTRDGDLDLYKMDADGGNVVRLTDIPGYDGGAFFSPDCSQIVWRASRPAVGEELDEYRALFAEGLVRPSQLELWVAAADGSDARQVTYLESGSFAPYFHPSGERLLFSTNYGNDNPREFDIWAVDVQGTRLERITASPGFDGFPMFSPDGSRLAFSSNRNQGKPGETNVFVARWVDSAPRFEERAADRFLADVAWLADDAREGRGVGTEGLAAAAGWLEQRLRSLGLDPAFGDAGYRQAFEVPVSVTVEEGTAVVVDGEPLAADVFRPAPFSAAGEAAGEVVPAGYGVTAPDLEIDDYAGVDVEGRIALVRRFLPDEGYDDEDDRRRYSDLRYKAYNAREHGAVGLIVVDLPRVAEGEEAPEEAPLPSLSAAGGGDAGIPVVIVGRDAGRDLFAGGGRAQIALRLSRETETADNVAGVIVAGAGERLPGALVLGAHYDHLGFGGRGSMAPDRHEVHNGADDNASGTAALLEAARQLAARRDELARDVYVVAFSGEESGNLGSSRFTREPPPALDLDALVAMVNMDMVGRLRDDRLSVLGGQSAAEWSDLVPPLCAAAGLSCKLGGDGYGPSDHTPFYASGAPVLHLFTGVHDDYHKPSDDTRTINAAGGAQVAGLAAELAVALAGRAEPLTYKAVPSPPPQGDARSYGASLGTVPDYAGAEEGTDGVLIAGVRPGSAAEKAGIRRGDVLVSLAGRELGDIYDFVYVLRDSKPGQTVRAAVLRDGERLELEVTFDRSSRPMR